MRGNLRGVQGPSTVTKLAPSDQKRRYGSEIEITSFKLSRREVQVPAWSKRSPSFMSVLQKVGKEEVQGSCAAQARSQGMEEQVTVKQLFY